MHTNCLDCKSEQLLNYGCHLCWWGSFQKKRLTVSHRHRFYGGCKYRRHVLTHQKQKKWAKTHHLYVCTSQSTTHCMILWSLSRKAMNKYSYSKQNTRKKISFRSPHWNILCIFTAMHRLFFTWCGTFCSPLVFVSWDLHMCQLSSYPTQYISVCLRTQCKTL